MSTIRPETNNFHKLNCFQESHQRAQGNFVATFPAHSGPPFSLEQESYHQEWQSHPPETYIQENNNLKLLRVKRTTYERMLPLHPIHRETATHQAAYHKSSKFCRRKQKLHLLVCKVEVRFILIHHKHQFPRTEYHPFMLEVT